MDDDVVESGRAAAVKTFRWRICGRAVGHVLEVEIGGEWVEQARGSRRGCGDVLSDLTQGKRKLMPPKFNPFGKPLVLEP